MGISTRQFVRSYSFWAVLLGLGLSVAAGVGFRNATLAQEADDEDPPKTVTVEPQKEFSIRVSNNPSTGYNVGLAYVSEGIFLLRTEPVVVPRNAPPGAPSDLIFHFFHWHPTQPDEPLEIAFGRFKQSDLQGTYKEEKYVLQVQPAPKGKKNNLGRTPPKTAS